MKTNLNNLSNATLINIITDLNTALELEQNNHINTLTELATVESNLYSTSRDLSRAYIEIAKLNIETTHDKYLIDSLNNMLTEMENDDNIYGTDVDIKRISTLPEGFVIDEQEQAYYAKHDNDEIPNADWIDNTDAIFTEEIDWDTQTEFPPVSDLLVRCTSCDNIILASESHRINPVIVECDTCFATGIPF